MPSHYDSIVSSYKGGPRLAKEVWLHGSWGIEVPIKVETQLTNPQDRRDPQKKHPPAKPRPESKNPEPQPATPSNRPEREKKSMVTGHNCFGAVLSSCEFGRVARKSLGDQNEIE